MASARYFVARYTADLLRQETKNVGVFLIWENQIYAKFIGEREPGQVDRRLVRGVVTDTDAYQEWVRFWRRYPAAGSVYDPVLGRNLVANEPADVMTYFEHASGASYTISEGGEALSEGSHTRPETALNFIYTAIVDEGGIIAATENEIEDDTEPPTVGLAHELADEFREMGLLGRPGDFRRGAIVPRMEVHGSFPVPHRPDFVQQNGSLSLIATVDFSSAQKTRAQEHAGTAAFIFDDIKKSHQYRDVQAFSVVRGANEGAEQVQWGLTVLRAQSEIVEWEREESREAFLGHCAQAARL